MKKKSRFKADGFLGHKNIKTVQRVFNFLYQKGFRLRAARGREPKPQEPVVICSLALMFGYYIDFIEFKADRFLGHKKSKQYKEFSIFYTKKLLVSVQLGAASGASTNLLIGTYVRLLHSFYRTKL